MQTITVSVPDSIYQEIGKKHVNYEDLVSLIHEEVLEHKMQDAIHRDDFVNF